MTRQEVEAMITEMRARGNDSSSCFAPYFDCARMLSDALAKSEALRYCTGCGHASHAPSECQSRIVGFRCECIDEVIP